jgi:hypothetical protein
VSHLDRALKLLWRRDPRPLVQLVTGLHGVRVQPVAGELHQVRRDADLVARVDGPHGSFILHLELESAPKADLPSRLLAYNVFLREALGGRPLVRSAVLLVRKARRRVPEHLTLRHGEDLVLHFQFAVVHLASIDALDLAQDPVLAPLAPLGADAGRAAVEAAVATLQGLAAPARHDGMSLLYVLGGEALRPTIRAMLDMQEVRMGWAYQEILEEGERKGVLQGQAQVVAHLIALKWPGQAGQAIARHLPRCGPDELVWLSEQVLTTRRPADVERDLVARLGG